MRVKKTGNDLVAFAEFTSKEGWEQYQVENFSVQAISKAFEVKNSVSLSKDQLNRHIVKLKTKPETIFAIVDFGSPMSIINEKTLTDYKKTTNQQNSNISHGRMPLEI